MNLKREWRPNPKQELFLSLPVSIFEAFLGGGNSSGKSDVLLIYALARKWHQHPRFKQVFMRRTFPELRNEIVPRARQIYPTFGATFNKSDMCWTFPSPDQFGGRGMSNSGAMIFLAHCEDEKDVHKYDSMEINLFTPDELTSFTEYIYLYIGFTRVRSSDSSLPAIIRTAGTPGGVGHTFTKRRFIDPAKEGHKVIVGKGGNKRFFIHATVDDNPHADPTYAQKLNGLTADADRKAKRYGDWDAYLGQVFEEFRDRHYPDEPANALHVIEPFDIPSWWPRLVVGDWGFAAMTWIGFAAVSPSKRIYLYREMSFIKTKIAEWAPYAKEHIDRENPRAIKFCKSAGQDRGQEHTIQEQISSALGRTIELTNNSPGSRVAGKMLLHEYLRWRPKYTPPSEIPTYNHEHALWLIRNRGLEEYKSYLATFNPPEEEQNIPKLQIFRCGADAHDGHPNCCPLVIDAIKACSYDKPRDNKPAEDVAEFEGDDPYDGIRYVVDAAEMYFTDAEQEFSRIQKQEEIIQKLSRDNDWTAFYRNMERIESSGIKPVSRYHHAIR